MKKLTVLATSVESGEITINTDMYEVGVEYAGEGASRIAVSYNVVLHGVHSSWKTLSEARDVVRKLNIAKKKRK